MVNVTKQWFGLVNDCLHSQYCKCYIYAVYFGALYLSGGVSLCYCDTRTLPLFLLRNQILVLVSSSHSCESIEPCLTFSIVQVSRWVPTKGPTRKMHFIPFKANFFFFFLRTRHCLALTTIFALDVIHVMQYSFKHKPGELKMRWDCIMCVATLSVHTAGRSEFLIL